MKIGPELQQLLESDRLWAFERKETPIYGDNPHNENGLLIYPIIGHRVEYHIGVLRGEAQVRWCRAQDPNDLPLAVSNAAWI